jgi:hypothetical protein
MSEESMSRGGLQVYATALALVFGLGCGAAQAEGLFSYLGGSWSGSGTIALSSGSRERISCRASYSPGGGGTTLRLALRCASDSFKFDLRSDLSAPGGSVSGTWSEVTRNVSGTVTGGGTPEQIIVTARSPTFSAFLTVNTNGNRQNVVITSPGSEMNEVSITLARAGRR